MTRLDARDEAQQDQIDRNTRLMEMIPPQLSDQIERVRAEMSAKFTQLELATAEAARVRLTKLSLGIATVGVAGTIVGIVLAVIKAWGK